MWEGGGVGIRAMAGKKWPGLSWGATGAMALQLMYYIDQMMIIYDRVWCGRGRDYFDQPFPERQGLRRRLQNVVHHQPPLQHRPQQQFFQQRPMPQPQLRPVH